MLQEVRKTIEADKETPDYDLILNKIKNKLLQGTIPSLKPVINASGVLLHTNLGRAPLSSDALSAIQSVASAYSNLEYDLGKGSRGKGTFTLPTCSAN